MRARIAFLQNKEGGITKTSYQREPKFNDSVVHIKKTLWQYRS